MKGIWGHLSGISVYSFTCRFCVYLAVSRTYLRLKTASSAEAPPCVANRSTPSCRVAKLPESPRRHQHGQDSVVYVHYIL